MHEEIFISNIATYQTERLTENDVTDQYPSISPDGTRIVYTSEADGQGRLYIMDLDTHETHLLTPDQDGYHAVWSPDGQWVAFMSNYQNGGYDAPSYGDLWLIRADGTQAQRLISKVSFSEPLWLP
jgi:TolB protein